MQRAYAPTFLSDVRQPEVSFILWLLICLDATKFVWLSGFTLIETICPTVCSKSQLKCAKSSKTSLLKLPIFQPRSQGSLLPVPTERERRVGERTWERGCLFLFQFGGCGSHCFNFDKFRDTASLKEGVEP